LSAAANIVVVIPCLNESGHIADLVRAVRPHVARVIVVDDGSTDATGELAQGAGAMVIRHAHTLGKGAALNAGLARGFTEGFQFALTMDGDGQHDPADLPTFIAVAAGGEADLVIGNRMLDAPAMPWLRRQVNRWMSRRLSQRAGRELPDTQCGYRLVRLAAWRELKLRTTGFEVESEMLLAFLNAGRAIRFVPVRTLYQTGRSKIHPVRDTLRWFRWWHRSK